MTPLGRACDLFVGLGLAGLILFTPLAFGSVETWSIVIMESAVFCVGFAWMLGRLAEGRERPWNGLEIPIILFLVVIVFQMIPLPRAALSVVSPRASRLYERTVPGYARGPAAAFDDWLLASDAARAEIAPPPQGESSIWTPASYSVPDTRHWLMLFAAYAVVFLVVAERFRNREKLRRLIVWIVFVGVGIAILGIFQKLTWNGRILWFRAPGPSTRPFGPFVNPNHFAGYMELIVPLALGLLLTLLSPRAQLAYRRSRGLGAIELPGYLSGAAPVRRSLGESRSIPWTATSASSKALLLGFLLSLSVGSIVLSLSRGGFMATILTLCLFAPLLVPAAAGGRALSARLAGFVALGALVAGVSFWVGASAIAERATTLGGLKSEPSFLGRAQTWDLTLDLARDHAMLGSGLGTFETAFSGYYPTGTYSTWKQAHNDYLQLFAESGVAGLIPALLALAIFFRRHFVRALLDREDPDRYLAIGLTMAIVSMLLHSFVDFSLQIPAVGLLFVMIGGLLVALSTARSAPVPTTSSSPPRRGLPAAGTAVLLALAFLSIALGARKIRSERLLSMASKASAPEPALAMIERAAALCPRDAAPVKALGDRVIDIVDLHVRAGDYRWEPASLLLDRAEQAYRKAVALTPLSSWSWWGLGQVHARRSHLASLKAEIQLERLVPATEADLSQEARLGLAALRTAILLEPNSYQIRDELANLLYDQGLRSAALAAFAESLRIMPVYERHELPPAAALPTDVYMAVVSGLREALKDPQATIDRADVQKELGQIAALRRDLPEAERRYRLGLEAASSKLMNDILAALLGDMLRQEGHYEEAAPLLERTTSSPAVGWRSWVSLGYLRAAKDDHPGALAAFRAASAGAPDEMTPAVLVAREMARCGDRKTAVAQLQYLIRTKPPAIEGRQALIEILHEGGQTQEALREADALVELAPERSDFRAQLDGLRREAGAGAPAGSPR